jgi:hypothetical protein
MQAEPVMPLRDPTSDMAVIARAGSKLVKDIREKKEASKSRKRFWEMAGSKMGKITGARARAGRGGARWCSTYQECPPRGGSAPSWCALGDRVSSTHVRRAVLDAPCHGARQAGARPCGHRWACPTVT